MKLLDDLLRFVLVSAPPGTPIGVSTTISLGSGYSLPQPPVGIKESRDLAHGHPELVKRYARLKELFQQRTGRQLFETCTWRSCERQNELYQQGRRGIPGEKTVTQLDGVTKKSRHNVFPSEAIDAAVDTDPGPGKHVVWDRPSYEPIGPIAIEVGLIWGGSWHIDDYPHLELPAGAA